MRFLASFILILGLAITIFAEIPSAAVSKQKAVDFIAKCIEAKIVKASEQGYLETIVNIGELKEKDLKPALNQLKELGYKTELKERQLKINWN